MPKVEFEDFMDRTMPGPFCRKGLSPQGEANEGWHIAQPRNVSVVANSVVSGYCPRPPDFDMAHRMVASREVLPGRQDLP